MTSDAAINKTIGLLAEFRQMIFSGGDSTAEWDELIGGLHQAQMELARLKSRVAELEGESSKRKE